MSSSSIRHLLDAQARVLRADAEAGGAGFLAATAVLCAPGATPRPAAGGTLDAKVAGASLGWHDRSAFRYILFHGGRIVYLLSRQMERLSGMCRGHLAQPVTVRNDGGRGGLEEGQTAVRP